jgi:hypothetical protein
MPSQFSGGCACGAIRYECTVEPVFMGNCHCRDCQRATGSAYFAAVVVREAAFKLVLGDPSWHESQADRGHTIRRAFCSKCGSPVFIQNSASPKTRVLYAGSLDDPSWYRPSRDFYVASAQPWAVMNPDLPKDQKMPNW